MAWIDDRIGTLPKFVVLSDRAFRVWVQGVGYSSGYGLRGLLEPEHQRLVGATKSVRKELITRRVWDEVGDGSGSVMIHDWAEHNEKRDKRREHDRNRKREARASIRDSLGASAGQSTGRSPAAARVETVETHEGSETHEDKALAPVALATRPAFKPGHDSHESRQPRMQRLLDACRLPAAERFDAETKLFRALKGATEANVACAIEAATGPGVRDPLAVVLSELKKRKAAAA